MMEEAIHRPMTEICDTVNTIARFQNPSQASRLSPLLPVFAWGAPIVTSSIVGGASAYLGYKLGEAD